MGYIYSVFSDFCYLIKPGIFQIYVAMISFDRQLPDTINAPNLSMAPPTARELFQHYDDRSADRKLLSDLSDISS